MGYGHDLLPLKSLLALAVALIALVMISILTYRSLAARSDNADAIRRSTSTRNLINKLLLQIEQAQGGQRGFVLTQDVSMHAEDRA